MTIMTTESTPPSHLVRAMSDDPGPLCRLLDLRNHPDQQRSRVVLTEVATFKNPLFRVMTRIFGQTKYMDEHLEDLAKKIRRNRAPDVALRCGKRRSRASISSQDRYNVIPPEDRAT